MDSDRTSWLRAFTPGYFAVLAVALALAVGAGWTPLSSRVDGDAYDWMYRLHPPSVWTPETVVLAIDEESLAKMGGVRRMRSILSESLDAIAAAGPAVVAIDLILSDTGEPGEDAALEAALRKLPRLVLAADLVPGTLEWELPAERFRLPGVAIGHAHALPEPVSRVLPLEKVDRRRIRRWALALEALRLRRGVEFVEETPADLTVGDTVIPSARAEGRPMYIRYLPLENAEGRSRLPQVTPWQLRSDPAVRERVRGKVVMAGVTAQSAARDRLLTPFNTMMSGVEIHANAYETLAQGRFFEPVSNVAVVAAAFAIVALAGWIFVRFKGWPAYVLGAALVGLANVAPHLAFQREVLLAYLPMVLASWFGVVGAAAWQYFVVRRQLRKSEDDKARYQQAIHFVTHEMRSPLTAIQGSSELMGRYNLTDEKRKQMAQMIHSESKRLARMIQTFLDIERLTDGQMELKKESFSAASLIDVCLDRVKPLAERKQIAVELGALEEAQLSGDRELMEYAVYNLLTNAVKYSPAETRVRIDAVRDGAGLRIAVADQGMGMDAHELKNIFQKFYRTTKAEQSGEAGTGIGLSIVQQIVVHHGGRMEVTSSPGKGSCFTIVMPRVESSPALPAS